MCEIKKHIRSKHFVAIVFEYQYNDSYTVMSLYA